MTNEKILKFLELLENYRSTDEILRLSEKDEEKLDTELSLLIEELKANNIDYKDLALRTAADFDNYKKRMAKERLDIINSANKDIISDLIEVIDDFERVESNIDKNNEILVNYHEGVKLINNKLLKILNDEGCEKLEISNKGQTKFDPNYHEALATVNQENVESGYITDIVQNGWMLNNKLLRPAKVLVQN